MGSERTTYTTEVIFIYNSGFSLARCGFVQYGMYLI